MQCRIFLTAIGTLLLLINGVLLSESPASRTPGYLDFDNLPETNFTCEGKVIGGYYADIETGCQMFHVCTIGQRGDRTDIKFLCLNGTVFDQETRVCERVDEVDCKRSKDFYDLNLELYHSAGGILPEDETPEEEKKPTESEEAEVAEEIYDDSYELETEEPQTTTKTSTTTTTTTTTTPKPEFTSTKQTFNIVLPNIKNKNTGTHLTGFVPTFTSPAPSPTPAPVIQQPIVFNENRNTGTHLTGFVPGIPSHSPRPFSVSSTPAPYLPMKPSPTQSSFGQPQLQQFGYHRPAESPVTYPKVQPIDTGLKPPPNYQFSGQSTSTSYKPPSGYESYKNYLYPSSTPITPTLVDQYGQKTASQQLSQSTVTQQQHTQQYEVPARSRPTVHHHGHHFPAPTRGASFEDFSSPGSSHFRYKPSRQHFKAGPTILALQSQQQKVHQLHQEGLEHAEHQIAQIASRNAEISNLQSQRDETARTYDASNEQTQNYDGESSQEYDNDKAGSIRQPKEIRASKSNNAIAVVTTVSSSSSRVQKQPITSFVKTVTNEKGIPVSQEAYTTPPELQTELDKLFKNAPNKKNDDSDMDLEQLLLAWKLKTHQEVTKGDIEKVFHSLDLSKFKNGETVSLTDIFKIMNSTNSDRTTKMPPATYDDYTEEDVLLDPFYKDVPKVGARSKRNSQIHVVSVHDNGKFKSHAGRRKGKESPGPISIADIEVLTGSVHGWAKPKDGEVSDDSALEGEDFKLIAQMPGAHMETMDKLVNRDDKISKYKGMKTNFVTRKTHSPLYQKSANALRRIDVEVEENTENPAVRPSVVRSGRKAKRLPTESAFEEVAETPVRTPSPRHGQLKTIDLSRSANDTAPNVRPDPGAPSSRRARGRGSTKFRPYGDEVPKPGSTARPFPKTSFSCRDKIPGGFYADTQVDCQLFHICTDAGDGTLIDQPFYCGDATRFNQRSRTCQAEDLVDCSLSLKYYDLNENFKGGAQSSAPVG